MSENIPERYGDAQEEAKDQRPLETHGKGPVSKHIEVPQLHTTHSSGNVCRRTALRERAQ